MYGILKFDGEYKNGMRQTGKIFSKNNSISELKNGIGYIKYYNSDGILMYEAEYLNGNRNGKGKEYYGHNKLRFDGEYKEGKK